MVRRFRLIDGEFRRLAPPYPNPAATETFTDTAWTRRAD